MPIKENRIRILIVLGIMLCIMSCFAACGDESPKYSLPDVAEGSTFEITVRATSGPYSWSYEISPNKGIEYVTREFIPTDNDPEMIGGGQLRYTFKATKVGCYEIKFMLLPLGKSEPSVETDLYKITVVGSE